MLSPLQLLGAIIALNAGLLLIIILWRQWLYFQERKQQRFIDLWRPILMQCSLGEMPSSLPSLPTRERFVFLVLWNEVQRKLEGSASPRITHLFHFLDLLAFTLKLLHSKNLRKQLLATQTFGYLNQAEKVWPELVKNAFNSHAILSFFSIHTMVQMSPEAALPVLLTVLQQRRTSKARLLGLFRRFPSPSLVNPLTEQLQDALYADNTVLALDIISLLELLPYPSVLPVMRQVLVEADSPELIISCLQVMAQLHDPWALGLALPYLHHPEWKVRCSAIKALSVVAQESQIPQLISALEDPSYWVASAALEGLYHMPGIKRERLVDLATHHTNPEVQKMMLQYLSEQLELTE